jgi:hypothetical protein
MQIHWLIEAKLNSSELLAKYVVHLLSSAGQGRRDQRISDITLSELEFLSDSHSHSDQIR